MNINKGCGATDLALLQAKVLETRADLGVALDGDGDRLMLIDPEGRVVDGDDIVYLLACHWQQSGRLKGPVVGTVMTNFGVEQALNRAGIAFLRANVGDRYVLELLKSSGSNLGGEASGHVLCLDRASTGDALVCALQVLEVMAETGKSLSELLCTVARVPQTMINVKITSGAKPLAHADVAVALQKAQETLRGRGRVVLRASGTEPLVRVTVEGEDAAEVSDIAFVLSEIVKRVSL